MAHVHGRPDDQEEWLDDLLGRGPGDPDVYGYPGEEAEPDPKAPSQNKHQAPINQKGAAYQNE